jgi:hypothetical protein
MKCKHCGLVFQARQKAAPVKARPAVRVAAPAGPAVSTPRPNGAVPVAPPVAPAAPSPFARFDDDSAPGPRRSSQRRRSGGTWWKGVLIGVGILVLAVSAGVLAGPYLVRLVGQPPAVVIGEETGKSGSHILPGPETERTKPPDDLSTRRVDTKPTKPVDTKPNKPPGDPQPAASKFPRRALIVSVNNYLYFNPVNYGVYGPSGHNVHTLIDKLNYGLHVPLDQVFELSDAAPDAGTKGGGARSAARPPLKPVIEQTVTDFLQTSRSQDRILLLFIGHVVDLEGEVYLVPVEGEQGKKESLIPLKWLYDKLAACPAWQKVLVMDVCRFDPSRGFERPGSGSADGKTPGAMTAKIDEALQNPPAGVQVWSACVADQDSLEYENNGVFADALWLVLARGGLEGIIQHAQDPIRLDRLAELVNKQMTAELKPYNKTQTSRVAGKEPEGPGPYDPAEQAARRIEPKLPSAADVLTLDQVRKLLRDVNVPPIKMTKDEMTLRPESLPFFKVADMKDYLANDGIDTEFRQAVQAAARALNEQLAQAERLREEWFAPANENAFKTEVTNYQKEKLAKTQRILAEAFEDLKAAGTPEKRKEETSRRWLANYDYIAARLEEQLAYMDEYQGLLGQLKKELPPRDPTVHNGWRVASQATPSDSAAKKEASDAKKRLDKIIKDYPDTPWEVLAKRDRLTALGLEWQAFKSPK